MSWKTEGKSPDYRFTLANERTFLAWIRTALAFLAATIGVDQLAPDLAPEKYREGFVCVLGILAATISLYAYKRWSDNEKAMRLEGELPYPRLLILLSIALTLLILSVLLITFLW